MKYLGEQEIHINIEVISMNKKNGIKIDKEKREGMISSIKSFFLDERDEDLGDLASSLILDFIIDELAPAFYNQGVEDSYKYMSDKLEDLLGIKKYRK
jgi:uncharacterized protein (DUF2164 family)